MNRCKAVSLVNAVLVGLFLLALSSPALLAHDECSTRPNAYRQGERMGYEYGLEHGRNDRYAEAGYDLNSRTYRRATAGYDLRFGSWREYREGFRAGYEAGYNAGYYERRGGHRRGWRRHGELFEE